MMYIFSGGKEIINSDFIERFCIVEKVDASLVIASYNDERRPVTIGRYADFSEAQAALTDLFTAISGGQAYFYMPDSRLFYGETKIHDARRKRRGGS